MRYEDVEVGIKVVLGRHTGTPANWASRMDQYVGKVAIITKLEGKVPIDDYEYARVDIDGEQYLWRVENMEEVNPAFSLPTPENLCIIDSDQGEWNLL
jgi:hypothetical protein